MTHGCLDVLESIINALRHPNVSFIVHVDSKYKGDLPEFLNDESIYLTPHRISVQWGGLSIVDCVTYLCEYAHSLKKFDYFVLISGNDYPVKSASSIYDYLSQNKDNNYIAGLELPSKSSTWIQGGYRRLACYPVYLKHKRIAAIEPRKFDIYNLRDILKVVLYNPFKLSEALRIIVKHSPRKNKTDIRPFGGEMWWMMNAKTVEQLLIYLHETPEYYEYHRNTIVPDEIFFNSLAHSMAENVVNDTKRYINWKNKTDLSPATISITDSELLETCISDPEILFVRKVNDIKVCKYIDSII